MADKAVQDIEKHWRRQNQRLKANLYWMFLLNWTWTCILLFGPQDIPVSQLVEINLTSGCCLWGMLKSEDNNFIINRKQSEDVSLFYIIDFHY